MSASAGIAPAAMKRQRRLGAGAPKALADRAKPAAAAANGFVMLAPMKTLARWILLALALLLVAHLYPGVQVKSFVSALIAAFVLGLLNTLLRPVLVLLTLPVTVLSLGLFLFVINALMFWFAAGMLEGFAVTGFGAALIGSLIYSLCGMLIDVLIERVFVERDA
jgi:putative membrane protein